MGGCGLPSCVGPIPPDVMMKSYFWTIVRAASTLHTHKPRFYCTEQVPTYHPPSQEPPLCVFWCTRLSRHAQDRSDHCNLQVYPILEAVSSKVIRVTVKRLPVQDLVAARVQQRYSNAVTRCEKPSTLLVNDAREHRHATKQPHTL